MKGSVVKEAARKRAGEMAEERAKRTSQQQIERLDQMFGKGKGATKERAKLAKLMGEGKQIAEGKKGKKKDK
jgi:ABC-type enterochelin transport system substrate-binding protein